MKRLLKIIGESSFWKISGRLHARLYRWSGGRLGLKTGKLSHLLLTSTGRKSGKPRTVPLTFMPDGDAYILVASNGGADRNPAWWLNLETTPAASIQVGSEHLDVVASRADTGERARLWPMLKQYNAFYGRYEQITDRDIPVVILKPA